MSTTETPSSPPPANSSSNEHSAATITSTTINITDTVDTNTPASSPLKNSKDSPAKPSIPPQTSSEPTSPVKPSLDVPSAPSEGGKSAPPRITNGDQVEKTLKRKLVLGAETSVPEQESEGINLKKVKEDGISVTSSSESPVIKPGIVPGGGFSSFASSPSPFVTSSSSSKTTTINATPHDSPSRPASSVPSPQTLAPQPPSSTTTTSFSGFLPASGASPFTSGGPKSVSSPSPFSGATAFSAFASSNPFVVGGKKKDVSDVLSGDGEDSKEETEADGKLEKDGKKELNETEKDSSFGQILSKGQDVAQDDESKDSESGLKMEAQDVITGEEEEDTKHQVRCKLYVMEKDGGWKERGTGLFKLNIHSLTKTPRLLMRADGIFRLILNVALFSGMKLEKQDKWVRFTAFEEAKPVHLAIRVGTLKSAEDLFDKIKSFVPPPKSTIDRSKTYSLAPFEGTSTFTKSQVEDDKPSADDQPKVDKNETETKTEQTESQNEVKDAADLV
ncbi:Ran-binding protein RANBP1 and related RanBD domain proteins [Phaffia rhodozyma]|uniref:Ran-binding protein RANBP1 and related RanBD domain proteins n=1 Tax=Phaffia rhodozyma TaxID=264483 RepID=A0A0F7SS73_PHARH|nr:Ran-binding protein RANBP1 and related RanBD domain proteins [Phaffia rhodozyma]